MERGQRRTNLPMSEPTHYKQKQEKSGDTIAENKHRKEEKQKTIFSFPPKKIFAE